MLAKIKSTASLRRPAWVTAERLNVSLQILGAPLATPIQRACAIAIDLVAVAFLSHLDGFWLALAAAVFFFQMRARAPKGWFRRVLVWVLCLICLGLAVRQGWTSWENERTVEAPLASAIAEDLNDASTTPKSESDRIRELEAALAEATAPQMFKWKTELTRSWNGLAESFGWAIVYFSLVPAWLNGQSIGKKILGLRVMELTGQALSVRICFSRYGGYAAGMATGFFGFAQILWDDNRQAIQDKVAHTVVVDLNQPYLPLNAEIQNPIDREKGG